jgi:hypothetical protein
VSSTGATLNGSINASFYNVNGYFDYGTTTAYGAEVSTTPAGIQGNTTTPVSATIAGLDPQTIYHFRARGITTEGLTVYGEDLSFTTGTGVPVNTNITGTITSDTCYNAQQTLTVGGSPAFIVNSPAIVTLIAGQQVLFMPGSKVNPGAGLHAYITTNSQYCLNVDLPGIVNAENSEVALATQPGTSALTLVRLYPNPATTSVMIEMMQQSANILQIEVFNMTGLKLMSFDAVGERKYPVSVCMLKPGIYFVVIKTTAGNATVKLIRI